MVNIWLISGNKWEQMEMINNGIAIDADVFNMTSVFFREDLEKCHDAENTVWYFCKEMKINDIVVEITEENKVKGIGKIKSKCITENSPALQDFLRYIEWFIHDNADDFEEVYSPDPLPLRTIIRIKNIRKLNEAVRKEIDKEPKFKKIFDDLHIYSNISLNLAHDSCLIEPSILSDALIHTKNVILYGPPGTGKTYSVQQFIKTFLADQLSKPKSFDDIKMEYLQDLTWYQITAVSMYLRGKEKKLKVADLKSDALITFYFERIKENTKELSKSLAATLPIYSDPKSETVKYAYKRPPALFDRTNKNEWYLTPDGIDYVETILSEVINVLSKKNWITEEKTIDQFCTFVTFHQSYGYEDFIEGLKPVVNDDGDVSYKVEAGVFKEISERARHDPENNYILVIDEINRGNIAKIFGELITLIEDDKRSEANKKGLSVKLPYSKTEFSVPSNLYILGTMNTADRSIALLDIALRRRFTFLEIMPDYTIIEFDVGGVNIASLLEGLNITVSALIDRDHQIGHSYFCEVAGLEEEQAKEKLYFIWYKKIIPLLQEYFYNDWDQLKLVLGDFVVENGTSRVPALKDKIVNKTYQIRDFEGDWDRFSMALNKIYVGRQELTIDEEVANSEDTTEL